MSELTPPAGEGTSGANAPSVKIVSKRQKGRPPQNRLVVALAYDGLCTVEFGVAVEIFGLDRPEMGKD